MMREHIIRQLRRSIVVCAHIHLVGLVISKRKILPVESAMVAVASKYGGNSTFINSFDKTQFLFHSPTDAAPQIL